MNKWNEARRAYENTPVPEALEGRVQEGIR